MSFTNFKTQLFFAVLFFTLLSQVFGHSYVTSPTSRSDQAQTNTGCRGPACLGPCDVPLSSKKSSHNAQRGDAISVQWPRNNHAGGFIRFAWAPTTLSDSHAAFDAHVQQINCHEVGGCHPDDPSNPNGGDSGPADGSSRACTSNFTIPLDLADGDWTLQWAWFGGAFNLGDYYSCVDYKIAGGAVGIMTPVFIGGDYANPNTNKCKFFNTDKLHICVNEPCYNGDFPSSAQQTGVPGYNFSILNQVPSTPSSPVTTAASAPVTPVTTAAAAPVRPSTTAAIRPSTTGKPMDITTGSTVPISTPTPNPPTVPISNPTPCFTNTGCILGNQFCAGSNQYQTCTNGRDGTYYAAPQSCQAGLSCHPSSTDNKIYCY